MRELILHPAYCQLDSIDKFEGRVPSDNDYDEVLESPVSIRDEQGNVVAIVVDDATKGTKAAYDALVKAVGPTRNRQAATIGSTSRIKKKDGTVSKTTQLPTHLAPMSSIVGYWDRYARTPYARACSFNRDHPNEWRAMGPFIRSVDNTFREYAPKERAIQRAVAKEIPPDWIIGDTAFSTITINKTYSINYHRDKGDLHEGLGVMAHLCTGSYEGGILVLPRFKKAIKFKNRDIILFDVHQVHGVTPIHGAWGTFERVTAVFYLRELLLRCGDAAHEVARSKIARSIGKLYDPDEVQLGLERKRRALSACMHP